MKVYGLLDRKMGAYQARLFCVSNDAVLARGLTHAFQKGRDAEADHPEDFEIYEFGEWDLETGGFALLPHPKFVLRLDILYQDKNNA